MRVDVHYSSLITHLTSIINLFLLFHPKPQRGCHPCTAKWSENLSAQPGKRDELAAILEQAAQVVGKMAGCRLYLVNEDVGDEVTVWIYEAWDNKAAHDASLQDDRVRALIGQAMPMLGGAPDGSELRLRGGHGLG